MKLAIVYLAALGFLVTACAHEVAILGVVLGGEGLVTTYFAGAIILFFPTGFMLSRRYPRLGTKFTWQDVLADCPRPIRVLFYAAFLYAFANFAFLWGHGVKTSHRSGEPLTAATARGLSGHAMVFHMAALAIMLSLHRAEKKNA